MCVCRLHRYLEGGDALRHFVAEAVGLGEFVVSLKDEPLCAVLAVFLDLALFQDAKGLAREVIAEHVFGVEDVAQLVAREAVQMGVIGIEFGANAGAALIIPLEWRAFEP